MKAIEFYRYIHDNGIEYHWHFNPEWGKEDVLFFPDYSQIKELADMLGPSAFDDGGMECVMKHGYFAFWASEILCDYDIEIDEIFDREG